MKTIKLYENDSYLKSADMTLMNILNTKDGYLLVFDKTVFFPTGGGQLCDTGEIAGNIITEVYEKDEVIYHKTKTIDNLNVGNTYTGNINWDVRFSHMQMHCGEHILSGAFYKLYGGVNKGFHMEEDYVTIDIECNKEITKEMEKEVEMQANTAVISNVPVTRLFFKTKKEAKSMPSRKDIPFDKNISIILVGDVNDPYDCCPCCGTHPKYSGEVGLIKIVHSEKFRGMFRYYVKFGLKALEDYSVKHDILSVITKKFSCEINNLEKAIKAEEERNRNVHKKLTALTNFCIDNAVNNIAFDIKNKATNSIRVYYYDYFTIDELLTLSRKIENIIDTLVILVSVKENICLLISKEKYNCSKLVKDYALLYKGKGGGKETLARAIFNNNEDLNLFIDLVEKHLRK